MKVNLQFFRMHIRLLVGSSLLVVALAALGLIGIVAVRYIPDNKVLEHARQSTEILVKEGDWPLSLCSRQDNFMDAMILNIASCDRRAGAFESALKNHFWVTDASEGVDAIAARFAQFDGPGQGMKQARYVRYWFGGIALVRPLLFLMNYSQWRMLNTVVVFASLVFLLYLMYATGLIRYGIAFLIPFALIDPTAIGKSLQFSPCFYLSMLPAMFLLLVRKARFLGSPACLALFFAGIGALTSYFDLLTYPIFTFCLPMAFFILLNRGNDTVSNVQVVVICLMHWFLGFVLMWLLKWILVTALTDLNAFYEVFQKVAERAGSAASDGLRISRLHAVRVNFMDFMPYLNVWLVGGFILTLVALRRGGPKLLLKWIPGFLIAALPPTWMFLTANHAYIHHFFVSKSLTAVVFVFLCWVTDAILPRDHAKKS